MQPTSKDFIANLNFEYFETYSLLRGDAFLEEDARQEKEYLVLKARKEKQDAFTAAEADRFMILEILQSGPQYLVNEKGGFHYSAKKTNTFAKDSPEAQQLVTILETETEEEISYRCPPVYRDAIVFYDITGKIVSVLDICLICAQLHNRESGKLAADHKTYALLESFFRRNGHDIDYYDNLFKAIREGNYKEKQH